MTATGPRRRAKPAAKRSARRLSRDARREQLIDVAMPLIAEHGLSGFSLDELAQRADVTRNLLYHYFPRGRADIVLAAGERAGHILTDGWIMDESIPLPERMVANFTRFFEHSEGPSDVWVIRRLGRASSEPELHAIIDRFEDIVISSVSLNNFGTPDPPPIARLAIKGFIAFSETVLDQARMTGVPREQVLALVAQGFASTLQSVRTTIE